MDWEMIIHNNEVLARIERGEDWCPEEHLKGVRAAPEVIAKYEADYIADLDFDADDSGARAHVIETAA